MNDDWVMNTMSSVSKKVTAPIPTQTSAFVATAMPPLAIGDESLTLSRLT